MGVIFGCGNFFNNFKFSLKFNYYTSKYITVEELNYKGKEHVGSAVRRSEYIYCLDKLTNIL